VSKAPPTMKEMRAFRIGARARKFLLEGCPIEGYDYLYGCLTDSRENDPELHALLTLELEKYEKRVAEMEEADV